MTAYRRFGLLLCAVIAPGETAVSQDRLEETRKAIRELMEASGVVVAIAAENIKTGERLLINERQMFHAASTMKTPVMVEVYRQVKDGTLSLDDSIIVKNEFRSIVDSSAYSMDFGEDSDDLVYRKTGQKMSIRELMFQMITVSSNFATNILIDIVDAKNVMRTMREMGAMDIKVLRGVEDLQAFERGLNNETNAYDLMLLMSAIARGTAVDSVSSNDMIDVLLAQKFNTIIPAELPEGVRVAHKTGSITGILHDSGIVFMTDGSAYSVVILSKGWKAGIKGSEILAKVSRLVYDAFTGSR